MEGYPKDGIKGLEYLIDRGVGIEEAMNIVFPAPPEAVQTLDTPTDTSGEVVDEKP